MGYSPPATAPTRILGPDGVPLKGDVSVTPGNFQTITRVGNGLQIASAAQKRARALEMFVPGVLAARTLFVASGLSAVVLSGVDAYFKTAPGAGTDGANFAALKLDGGAAAPGPVTFAFNAQVPEYHLGLAALSQVLGQSGNLHSVAGNVSPDGGALRGTKFHPTANIAVGGMGFGFWDTTKFASFTGGFIRVGLAQSFTKDDGYTGNTTPWLTCRDGSKCFVDVPLADILPAPAITVASFASPVDLVNGTDYIAVGINPDGANAQAPGVGLFGYPPAGMTGNIANVGVDNVGSIGTYGPPYGLASPWSADWSNATHPANYNFGFGTMLPGLWFALYGAVLGTPLATPVKASITVTGAPANPGSDLIVSVQF